MQADDPRQLTRTRFAVPRMDCPSEEQLIRAALAGSADVRRLSFDLAGRELDVLHAGPAAAVLDKLKPLNLGARIASSADAQSAAPDAADADGDAAEARTLKLLLAINAVMFVFELASGLLAQSSGLVADSLDMFADAAVYGLALYAVGHPPAMKVRAAHVAGWLQAALALGALAEVARRGMFGSAPQSVLMVAVGLVALLANIACLALTAAQRGRGAHMRASYIFSANDVIANLGVIVAGALVAWTGSALPDLVIGTIIGLVVLNGARKILGIR